jgi:hypothetical protein
VVAKPAQKGVVVVVAEKFVAMLDECVFGIQEQGASVPAELL